MFDFQIAKEVAELYGQALPAALLMAVTFSVFGIFVVLKRIVFIGITLSEVAACGVAAALLLDLSPFAGAAVLCLLVVALLAYPYESSRLPRDAILGSIFIFASGMSILLVARSGFGLEKVKAILYGNLLFASNKDLTVIAVVMIPALFSVLLLYRPMLYSFLDRESAQTLGIRVWRFELLFFVFLGLIVASSSKIAGVMLVFCYLVIPAATALLLSRRMGVVILLAITISLLATWLGIMTSYNADLPPNQLIAVISCAFLLVAVIFHFAEPLVGKKIAGAFAVAGFFLLLLILNNLSLEQVKQNAFADIKKNAEAKPESVKPESWPGKLAHLEKLLAENQKEGVKFAIILAEQSPPEYFAEEIMAMLKQKFPENLQLNLTQPLSAPEIILLLKSLE